MYVNRVKALIVIKEKKPESVYSLAKLTKRDIKNVKDDLDLLQNLDLISLTTISEKRERIEPKLDYDKIDAIFLKKFENELNALHYQKKLFTNPYAYSLILYSIFKNQFVIKYIFKKIYSKFTSASKL